MKISNSRPLLIVSTLLMMLLIHLATGARAQSVHSSPPVKVSKGKSAPIMEGFYFLMSDYKMEHQGETNTLNIKVSYSYVKGIADDQYPDFIPIRKDVDKFLTEYPNEMTFWEILNKQLTSRLIEKYPALASVTCEIQVTPSSKYPFTRGSVVTRTRRELAKIEHSNKSYRRTQ